MITSSRNFGFEIEFQAPTREAVLKIRKSIPIVEDGSIRHIPNSYEYVSEVLSGSKGEKKIHSVCELLKKNGASGNDPAMSVHIHLDAKTKSRSVVESDTRPDGERVFAFSRMVKRELSEEHIKDIVLGRTGVNSPTIRVSHIDNVIYFSKAELSRHPLSKYFYYVEERADRFKWVKNMLYFYTQYSDVMEDMVSNSRKFGNMYCIPLGKSYDLAEIEAVTSMEGLHNLWYKGRNPSGHYDDSRYHNVNFHSVWDRHGTVEIRSHGGTIDPHKIVLWLKLHQFIADKLEEVELNDIKSVGNMHKNFVEFLDDELLQTYVKRLLGYYSGISIK